MPACASGRRQMRAFPFISEWKEIESLEVIGRRGCLSWLLDMEGLHTKQGHTEQRRYARAEAQRRQRSGSWHV